MSGPEFPFVIEYAKSGRSTCRSTKQPIGKGELRIGKMVQSPHFDGFVPQWHKAKVFFNKHSIEDIAMVKGRDAIRPDDIKWLESKVSGKRPSQPEGAEDAEAPAKKKSKKADPREAELKALWDVKDKLTKSFSNSELRQILDHNGMHTKGGEQAIQQRVAEGMLFGVLPAPPCVDKGCENAYLTYDSSIGMYKCRGAYAWAKCDYTTDTVKTTAFELPDWVDVAAFANWKYKPRKRVMHKTEVVRGASQEDVVMADVDDDVDMVGKASTEPFKDMVFAAVAQGLGTKTSELKRIVEELGGTFGDRVTAKTTVVISSTAELDKKSRRAKKLDTADKHDIPILSEDYVLESEKQKKILAKGDYLIGGTEAAKESVKSKKRQRGERREEGGAGELQAPAKVKVVKKGRAAVDPSAKKKYIKDWHVYDKGGDDLYDVMLNQTDVTSGYNSFYRLQILQRDGVSGGPFAVFRRWGRIGTTIGGTKEEEFYDFSGALASFCKVYADKTGNDWETRDDFEKVPGKFLPVEITYDDDDDDDEELKKKLKKAKSGMQSKLDTRVQSLISLIFDVKMMESALLEMEIDLKKMPLGKLSKNHIKTGMAVLKRIDATLQNDALDEADRNRELLALTNEFYTRIPHDFGANKPKLIDSVEYLRDRMAMVDALIDIEIATSLLKESEGSAKSELDAHYDKLKTDISPLDKTGDEWKIINEYLDNQKGRYPLKIKDIYKIARQGETERFDTNNKKAIPAGDDNRMLLWHGSRLTNYVGILSQGLRIAPPEAPKSGYRFGKGVYFASLCEKSAAYCRSGSGDILMMLCEVQLGNIKELFRDTYMEKPMKGSHSTRAVGRLQPDPAKHHTMPNGAVAPMGKPKNVKITSSAAHDEYIVYDIAQVQISYLLRISI